MRVLHVVPGLGAIYGGPSQLVPELACALVQRGVTVDIATTETTREESSSGGVDRSKGQDVVPIYRFRRHWPFGYSCSWPLAKWLLGRIRSYDLVHIAALFSFSTLAAARIAEKAGRPYVIAPHGMLAPWALGYKSWKKAPYFQGIERRNLEKAAGLQALTTEEGRHFSALRLSSPTFVIPNGIDLSKFHVLPTRAAFESQYPQTKDSLVLLFLGRIDPVKGLDILVPAFARLLQKRPLGKKIYLVIAGPDRIGYRRVVDSLVRQHNIQDRVIFTGMVTGGQKLAVLSAADVFVLPSQSEGLPIALLEALAVGCPVVATETCRWTNVGAAGAGVITGHSVDALEEGLAALIDNPSRREGMRSHAVELVREQFSWGTIATRLIEVYEDIVYGTRRATAWYL